MLKTREKKRVWTGFERLKVKGRDTVRRVSKEQLDANKDDQQALNFDVTAPSKPTNVGSRHPISILLNRIINIFERIGFVVAEEREIETDWYNFYDEYAG